VIVLDDGPVASGQTHLTTAHLSNAIDDRYCEVERIHGEEGARLAAQSHSAAIDLIEAICRDEQIECDFSRVDGYLFNPPPRPAGWLEHELRAAAKTGMLDISWAEAPPLGRFASGRCLRFGRQGQFHPLKYLAGLTAAIQRLGGEVYCHTHVTKVQGGSNARVESESGPVVNAAALVVATNTPVNDLLALHTKQA